MCSTQTGLALGKGEEKTKNAAGGIRRDRSDKTLMCKRTESYWGKKMVPEKGPEFWGLQEVPQANLSLTEESTLIWS